MKPLASDLTVVIPSLGRDVLGRSIGSLEAGTVWPAQVIVVDQGTNHEIPTLLETIRARGLDIRWFRSDERGRARGVNRGIELTGTKYLAVTDDDCLADPQWIELMSARLRKHAGAIITGRVDAGEGVAMSVTEAVERIQRKPSLRFDRLSGGNMGVETNLVRRLGGLDEDQCLSTAEDGELAYRALRSGIPIVYAPEVAVFHLGWRDEGERAAQYDGYARSQGGFYGKYLRDGDMFIAARAAIHLLRSLRRWLLGRLGRRSEAARIGRAYVTGLLPGIVAGWRSSGKP